VRMAAEQGMPVVIVDATLNLPPSLDVDYLLNDEQQTGELAVESHGQHSAWTRDGGRVG
jgi:ABC-type sugar transport system substrate-binding protein